jgi:hypothetical protein
MKFYQLVKEYVEDEKLASDNEISTEQRQKLVAEYIREADIIEQFEFIAEYSGSDNLPFYLANVLEHCSEEEIGRLPTPIKTLVETMVTGALEYQRKAIDEVIGEERRRYRAGIRESQAEEADIYRGKPIGRGFLIA